jgi:hypothetical protein
MRRKKNSWLAGSRTKGPGQAGLLFGVARVQRDARTPREAFLLKRGERRGSAGIQPFAAFPSHRATAANLPYRSPAVPSRLPFAGKSGALAHAGG